MDSEGSHVAAVSQAPTVSARPVAANSVISRPLLKPKRTAQGARAAVHQLKSPDTKKAGMRRPFVTRGNSKENALPKLERKENMDLDENSCSGKVKQRETEIYTPIDDKRDPLPGAELHMVYLTGKPIGDNGASLAYHKKFLEKVFGRHAEKIIIVYSYARIENSFGVWLTGEEVNKLAGQDEVVDVEYAHYQYEILD